MQKKLEAIDQTVRLRAQIRDELEPQQFSQPDEIWITQDHTRADRERERRQRAQNYGRQQDANQRRQQARQLMIQKAKPRSQKKRRRIGETSDADEPDDEISSETNNSDTEASEVALSCSKALTLIAARNGRCRRRCRRGFSWRLRLF